MISSEILNLSCHQRIFPQIYTAQKREQYHWHIKRRTYYGTSTNNIFNAEIKNSSFVKLTSMLQYFNLQNSLVSLSSFHREYTIHEARSLFLLPDQLASIISMISPFHTLIPKINNHTH